MPDILRIVNFGFAWLSVLFSVLLAAAFVTRRIARAGSGTVCGAAAWFDRVLRRAHVSMGVIFIASGLAHGLASSQTVWSLNVGTLCWVLSLLLGLNFLLRGKLKKAGGWMVYHRVLTIALLLSIVWHVADVGGIRVFGLLQGAREDAANWEYSPAGSAENAPVAKSDVWTRESKSPETQAHTSETHEADSFLFDGAVLKDGVYTGAADGFGPGLTVSVAVENGRVARVEVLRHNEKNARYYARPIETIPKEIVQNQTLHVDAVSGATLTSNGIVEAVYNALQNAVIAGSLS